MLSDRSKQLILAMCQRYEAGAYVDGSFLREHTVKASETVIFDTVATLLRGVCQLPDSDLLRLIMLGTGTDDQVANSAASSVRMTELSAQIQSAPKVEK